MTLVSLTDCCRLLAIDPKTLRRWMRLFPLVAQPHPADARIKGVTLEQLSQLAALHHRVLPAQTGMPLPQDLSVPLPSTPGRGSIGSDAGTDGAALLSEMMRQLDSLQAQVNTLHQQLTRLRDHWQKEQVPHTNEASIPQEQSQGSPQEQSQGSPQEQSQGSPQEQSQGSPQERSKEKESPRAVTASTDRRKHPHVLPRVEYGAQGTYVVICPEQGLLTFEPDSPEWFAWLSTLSSFRFVGQHGHFTANRNVQHLPRWSWRASRQIRMRSYSYHLGKTESVTLALLEQTAAALQSHLN